MSLAKAVPPEERLRICYVGHADAHFIPPYVDYFSARGHEVHLVSLHPDDVPSAIMHHPIRKQFDPMRDKLTYLWAQAKVRRVIRGVRPDIVHAHYLTSNGVMAALAGCRPLVVSARGSDVLGSLRSPWKRWLIRFAMSRADLVNVVSQELARHVRELGVPESKILVLTQGIELSRFRLAGAARSAGPPRLVCLRRLEPFFQGDRILQALALLAAEAVDFEFTFAATGSAEPELRRLAAAVGLGERVRFLGGFLPQALPELLTRHDIYVSAAPWDGTSPALLEAMAAGLFPVVSDTTANREWLTGDGDCLFFDWQRTDELLACLRRGCADRELRERPAAGNRQRVADRADRQANLAVLDASYHALVRAARQGSR